MAIFQFRMPDIGEGVVDAEIVAWHIKVGDPIKEDQGLVDVMTDKATVDISSPVTGQVIALHGKAGAMVPVGSVIAEIEVEAADQVVELSPVKSANADPKPAPEKTAPPVPPPPPPFQPTSPPLAGPATRLQAKRLGISLYEVKGTGPGKRITAQDLETHVAALAKKPDTSPPQPTSAGTTQIPIIGLRRKIAERMQDTLRIPQITYVEEMDLTELEDLRRALNDKADDNQPKLTLLPFFIRALTKALTKFPNFNARYDDKAQILTTYQSVHLGIATQTPKGLMVPVLRHAETHTVWSLATEIKRLAEAARKGTIAAQELQGSTISVSALGKLGGITTTPILNAPEVAILAPNRLVERPVAKGSFLSLRQIINLSSTFDHRIIDGYDAACLVQELKHLLEHPALLFMEVTP